MLHKMLEKRGEITRAAEHLLMEARSQGREVLNEGEAARLKHARRDIEGLNERIDYLRGELARQGVLPEKLANLRYQDEPEQPSRTTMNHSENDRSLVYRRNDPSQSWCRDMIRLQMNLDPSGESRSRLYTHAQQVMEHPAYQEHRDLSRVDGAGGYAVPPAWLMNQYIELARPGRAFANLVQRQPLPGGTDSINIPKLLTGTAVGIQSADNTPVTKVDLTDTFINAPVCTIAGQQGVSIQLIDQSPIAFDDIVFRDLVAAHAALTDTQCLSGSGSAGQVLGVDLTPGTSTLTVSALTIQGVYSAIANAIQLIHTQRFQPPDVIVMAPRRWGWFLSLLDNQQRPLFLPDANRPYNAAGILTDVASQQVVGSIQGLPVVTDPNVTTTSGAGTNEDVIYVLRASDIVLWESGIRARVLPET
jgi:HK97 family phage major capsid protein